MANAQYITGATETKNPPIGYTSGEINLQDTQTGVFSWDVSAYNPTDYPAWTGTWSRAVAIHVTKGATGASLPNSLQVRYTQGTPQIDGNIWHVSPNQLNAASTDPTLNLWWCGLVGVGPQNNGLDMNIAKRLELSVTADCASAQNSCPLGAGFTATAWFYQLANVWANNVIYNEDPVVGSNGGIVGGWSTDNTCFGGLWNNGASANSGNVALDVAFHPTDTEGYSANWETLSFNDMWLGGAYVQLYNLPLNQGTEVYPSISQWVERGSAAASDGLYATVRADADALTTQFMLCMSSSAGTGNSIWQSAGNAAYGSGTGQNFAYCDLGCYPNMDCSTTNVPNGGWTMADYDLTGTSNLWVTTLIVNSIGSGATFVTPGHSVAFAWGHPPSAATAFAPSLLLGVLALAAATLA
jgi:hypothetical protein